MNKPMLFIVLLVLSVLPTKGRNYHVHINQDCTGDCSNKEIHLCEIEFYHNEKLVNYTVKDTSESSAHRWGEEWFQSDHGPGGILLNARFAVDKNTNGDMSTQIRECYKNRCDMEHFSCAVTVEVTPPLDSPRFFKINITTDEQIDSVKLYPRELYDDDKFRDTFVGLRVYIDGKLIGNKVENYDITTLSNINNCKPAVNCSISLPYCSDSQERLCDKCDWGFVNKEGKGFCEPCAKDEFFDSRDQACKQCSSLFDIDAGDMLVYKNGYDLSGYNCKNLVFGPMGIRYLYEGLFDNFTTLELLDLKFNNITWLKFGYFDFVTKTNPSASIQLDEKTQCSSYGYEIDEWGHVQRKKDNAFFSQCQFLNMSNSGIFTLDADCFTGMTRLSTLDLTLNSIEQLSPDIFQSISNDSTIILDKQAKCTSYGFSIDKITGIATLNNLSDIEDCNSINLNNCSISAFQSNGLQTLTAMTNLQLKYNKFTDLLTLSPSLFYDNGSKLHLLDISNNQITFLNPIFHNKLTNLQYIDFSNNQIIDVNHNIFHSLLNVKTLLLNSNNITELINGTFQTINRDTNLSLHNNNISCCDSLAELSNLKKKGFDQVQCIKDGNVNYFIAEACEIVRNIVDSDSTMPKIIAIVIPIVVVIVLLLFAGLFYYFYNIHNKKKHKQNLLSNISATDFVMGGTQSQQPTFDVYENVKNDSIFSVKESKEDQAEVDDKSYHVLGYTTTTTNSVKNGNVLRVERNKQDQVDDNSYLVLGNTTTEVDGNSYHVLGNTTTTTNVVKNDNALSVKRNKQDQLDDNSYHVLGNTTTSAS